MNIRRDFPVAIVSSKDLLIHGRCHPLATLLMHSVHPLVLRAAVACAFFVSIAGCGGDSKKGGDADVKVGFGTGATREPTPGVGDVKITSTDNSIVLSVIGDTVRMQLSDSLRKSVNQNVDSAMSSENAIAAALAKSVSAVVSGALGFIVAVHVNDVENIRYEDGHLRFDVRGGKTKITSSGNSQDKAEFTPEDAAKFIDAVKSRQGTMNR